MRHLQILLRVLATRRNRHDVIHVPRLHRVREQPPAAQRAHVPLFLAGIAARRKRTLHSWDQFEIPYPFSRVNVWYSDPIVVPPDLQDAPLDEFLGNSQSQLEGLCANAEQELHDA